MLVDFISIRIDLSAHLNYPKYLYSPQNPLESAPSWWGTEDFQENDKLLIYCRNPRTNLAQPSFLNKNKSVERLPIVCSLSPRL